ncbi:hypothetical protein V5N11_011501 [Cardamine amara subsp. amara]|uniref:Reverse transcriptase zinc-binding domain-containing protein n=1 Tax=Cardamine amara subsp. amara TaxID=228776 RepID=A0ABD1B7R8_CARAN
MRTTERYCVSLSFAILLRHLATKFIHYNLGNGLTASLWHDHWAPQGPLIIVFGLSGPRKLGIPSHSTVASACTPLGWRLRPARSNTALELQMYLTTIEVPLHSGPDDEFFWFTSEREFSSFNAQSTWNDLRPRDSTKDWTPKIWFKGATPRHAFNMWIVHLDRLPTRQRLLAWGLHITSECCLCSTHEESIDHLLLRYEYSESVWHLALSRLRMPPSTFITWNAMIDWSSLSFYSSPSLLRRLVSQNVVYLLWQERKNMLHNQTTTTPEQLFRVLDRSIRDTILARRKRNAFRNLMQKWLRD